MAKKKNIPQAPRANKEEAPATLKDLLGSEVLNKLKARADELKNEENSRKEAERMAAEEARKAERKRLDNDFAHLLENSSQDWRKYK